MLSLRSLLLVSFLLTCISSFAISEPSIEQEDTKSEVISDLEAFQQLLDQVDPPALHAALHDYSPEKFKHGIFKEDRTAAEAVHHDDASAASSLVSLAKRQNSGNSTTVSVVATVTETSNIPVTATESVNPSTVQPNPVQPSDRSTEPATPSAQPQTSTPVASSNGVVVSSVTATTTIVAVSTESAASSAAGSSATLAPGPVSLSSAQPLTSGAVVTTTNAAGVTIISTINGGVVTLSAQPGSPNTPATNSPTTGKASSTTPQLSQTSLVLHTTTLSNGVQSTFTSVTVIQVSNPSVVTPTGSAGAIGVSGTSSGTPGLQTGLAPRTRGWGWEVVGVVGGAVGVVMVL